MFWLETRVVMRGTVAGQPNGRQLVGLTAWCGGTVSVMWGKVVKKMEKDGRGLPILTT